VDAQVKKGNGKVRSEGNSSGRRDLDTISLWGHASWGKL